MARGLTNQLVGRGNYLSLLAGLSGILSAVIILIAGDGDAGTTRSATLSVDLDATRVPVEATAPALGIAKDAPPPTPPPTPTPKPVLRAPLDGVQLSDAEWAARKDQRPIAVMIDNHPDANPHSGLDRADIVYEAMVEGGISRFMAVFWRRDAERIEPVRSARTPYIMWADELGAFYGHAGNAATSNEANAAGQLVDWDIADLDAFNLAYSDAYYRDFERDAPHNLVTSTAALRDAAAAAGYSGASLPAPWLFKRPGAETAALPAVGAIEVNFLSYHYGPAAVYWQWDALSGGYLRWEWGGPHRDAVTGEQLRFTNVVIMRADAHVLETGHVVYDEIGEGAARVFLDGKVEEATWRKPSLTERTRFFTLEGKEISFNPGPTFIEVLPLTSYVNTAGSIEELESGVVAEPALAPAP